jgi:hypothetical protein
MIVLVLSGYPRRVCTARTRPRKPLITVHDALFALVLARRIDYSNLRCVWLASY